MYYDKRAFAKKGKKKVSIAKGWTDEKIHLREGPRTPFSVFQRWCTRGQRHWSPEISAFRPPLPISHQQPSPGGRRWVAGFCPQVPLLVVLQYHWWLAACTKACRSTQCTNITKNPAEGPISSASYSHTKKASYDTLILLFPHLNTVRQKGTKQEKGREAQPGPLFK